MKSYINNEQQIIKNFFVPISNNRDSLCLSNDGAFIKNFKNSMVISSDMMIQDIHFKKKDIPELLARKLLRVNLSDLAAMGAEPYGYILNVGIPSLNHKKWLKSFCKGLLLEQKKFRIKLLGGDLSASQKIFLSITIIGSSENYFHKIFPKKKNSKIFVSGTIGDSFLGFQLKNNPNFRKIKNKLDEKSLNYLYQSHAIPEPRIKLSKKLKDYCCYCTDISDGLVSEINKMRSKFKLGCEIFLQNIPLSTPVKKILKISKQDLNIWENILCGGEDYELIFSICKDKEKKFLSELDLKKNKISEIGFFDKTNQLKIFDNELNLVKMKKNGFSHF